MKIIKPTKQTLSFVLSVLLIISSLVVCSVSANATTKSDSNDRVMKYYKTDNYEIWLMDKNNDNVIDNDTGILLNTENDYVETVGYLGSKDISTVDDIIQSYN